MRREPELTPLLLILLTVPALSFDGTVQTASTGAPSSVAVGASVRLDGDLFLNGQAYPIWFEAQNGPLHTWWFGAPFRPEVRRGWVSLAGTDWFDGVYGDYPNLYWKFSGPANVLHAPEPAIVTMFAIGACWLTRQKTKRSQR